MSRIVIWISDGEINGGEFTDDKIGKNQKMCNSITLSKSKKTVVSLDFLVFRTRLGFTKMKQVFVKAPIFYHFNRKCYI